VVCNRVWLRVFDAEKRILIILLVKEWICSSRTYFCPIEKQSLKQHLKKIMRILITGGAGFLGSHLSDRLLEQGHEIICLDNFFTGRKSNIQHLLTNPNFELVRHDVIDPFKFEVDQIYNLACPASPPHYQHNPIKTTKTSVMGAINCLGLAKRVKARVFQASTSEVYGDPAIHPQTESY